MCELSKIDIYKCLIIITWHQVNDIWQHFLKFSWRRALRNILSFPSWVAGWEALWTCAVCPKLHRLGTRAGSWIPNAWPCNQPPNSWSYSYTWHLVVTLLLSAGQSYFWDESSQNLIASKVRMFLTSWVSPSSQTALIQALLDKPGCEMTAGRNMRQSYTC